MGLPVLLEEICRLILQRHMNVEIGAAAAALFPEKDYELPLQCIDAL
jgi:hypothetical protein